jgi:hypothetical protein
MLNKLQANKVQIKRRKLGTFSNSECYAPPSESPIIDKMKQFLRTYVLLANKPTKN